MNETQLLKKLQLLKKRPDIAKELTPTELAELVVVVLGYAKNINQQIEAGKIKGADGKTPIADKDYLSLKTAERQITKLMEGAIKEHSQYLKTIIKGADGKTPTTEEIKAIINSMDLLGDIQFSETFIRRISNDVKKFINIPSITEFIARNPDIILNIIKNTEIEIDQVKDLPETLKRIEKRIVDSQSGSQGGTNKHLINAIVDERIGNIDADDIGLGNVDNTSDANKPISTATQIALNDKATDDIAVMALLGSSYKAMTLGVAVGELTATIAFSDAQIRFTPVYLKTAQTITGVSWYQKVQGNYVADNNNRIGLYSYSGGTLTLVASTTNDGTLWSTPASETFGSKAFSSTYNASAGIYFVGMLYNQSSQTTAPSIGGAPNLTNLAVSAYDFTNSAKLFSFVGTKTDLDSSINMSALTAVASRPWVALY